MSRLQPSATGTELLDDPAADPATVTLSLRNIARANRWFGGWSAVRAGLARLVPGRPGRPLTLLDVGTGLGDVPALARRWAKRRGIDLRPVGLERSGTAARLARDGGLATMVGCGGDLPVRSGGVDLVVVSQVAHHLAPDSCVTLFRECGRVARVGVVVADLVRLPAVGPAFRLGGRILRFDRITVEDGVTSLRRGFTPAGLAGLVRRAGGVPRVRRVFGVRLVAVWETAP